MKISLALNWASTPVALLHGSDCARIERARQPYSGDADALRASKIKHSVQGMNGNGDLCHTALIRP
jgi:hypothetical protein